MRLLNYKKTLGILTFGALLFIASCKKDDGTTAGADDADKYVGTWSCIETEAGQPASNPFDINITKVNANTVRVANFSQLGTGISATFSVSGSAVSINQQIVDGIIYNGTGSLSGSKMNLSYSGDDGQTKKNYSAVCTKK